MAKPKAVVDPQKCQPQLCSDDGMCPAARECPNRAMKQEVAGEIPFANYELCRGCSKCLLACPLKAIGKM